MRIRPLQDGQGAPASLIATREPITADVEVMARLVVQALFDAGRWPSPEEVRAVVAAFDSAQYQDLAGARETLRATAATEHVAEILFAATDDSCSMVCRIVAVAAGIASAHPFVLPPHELGAYAVGRAIARLA